MHWNNCWITNFKNANKFFLDKTYFVDEFFKKFFYEFSFQPFFLKLLKKHKKKEESESLKNFYFYEKLLRKTIIIRKKKRRIIPEPRENATESYLKRKNRLSFSRVWFVKFNNFVLVTFFIFFFIRLRKKKPTKKKTKAFYAWRSSRAYTIFHKKLGNNLKRNVFFAQVKKDYNVF